MVFWLLVEALTRVVNYQEGGSLTAPTLFSPKSNGPNVDNQRQGGSLGLKR